MIWLKNKIVHLALNNNHLLTDWKKTLLRLYRYSWKNSYENQFSNCFILPGGRHCLALTTDGKVFSWGEGDDGKLGHFSRW